MKRLHNKTHSYNGPVVFTTCVDCGSMMVPGKHIGKTFFICINAPRCGGKVQADKNELKRGTYVPLSIPVNQKGRKARYDLHNLASMKWGSGTGVNSLKKWLRKNFPESCGHTGNLSEDALSKALDKFREEVVAAG